MASQHHYVPAFYLDRFTNAKGCLRVYDRRNERTFPSTPAAVAKERDFYLVSEDARQMEDGTRVKRDFLEVALAEGESGAAEAIRRAVATGRIDPADRVTLASHIAMQLVRTRQARDDFDDMAAYFAGMEVQIHINKRLHAGVDELGDSREVAERALEQLRDGSLRVGTNRDGLIWVMCQAFLHVFPLIVEGWEWSIVSINTPSFITTDSPVTMLGEYDPRYPLVGVGVASALEVWYPLDPRHALLLSRDRSLPPLLLGLSAGHVKMLNMRLALESSRWIFHHPKPRPLKGIRIPREGPRFREEAVGTRPMPDGTTRELVKTGAERVRIPSERLITGRRLRSFPASIDHSIMDAAWAARDESLAIR